jgi:hypothetical protein
VTEGLGQLLHVLVLSKQAWFMIECLLLGSVADAVRGMPGVCDGGGWRHCCTRWCSRQHVWNMT